MSQKVANIAKNTSYFTLALILQKVISFTYFTIYARELGTADLGKYYFALSFTTIISLVMDFGIVNYFTKELSKDSGNNQKTSHLIGTAVTAKLLLLIPSVLIIWGRVATGGYDPLVSSLIYIAMLSMLMDAFTSLLFAVSRAHHNLKYESITAVISQTVTLLISLYVLHYQLGLSLLMWAQVASSLVSLLVATAVVRHKWQFSLKPVWDLPAIKSLFVLSFSFGLYVIFQRFYTYIDSVLLYQFAGDAAVGLYQVPFKITNALQFLPMAFVASLYPALSAYWKTNREQLTITFERAINYSVILALPITVGLIALTEPIVALMKSGYEGAVWPMRLAAVGTFFMFLNYPVGSLLNACDKQRANTRNMGITAVVALLMNWFLIQIYGVMGAVITVIITNALMFVLNWFESKKIIAGKTKRIRKIFFRSLLASLLMAIVVFSLKATINVLIVVPIGALVYFISLFLFGAFTKADLNSILKSFKLKN